MSNKELEVIDEIRNNILNNYGGVKEFIKDYGGDYFNEEYVNWFINVVDTLMEIKKVNGFSNIKYYNDEKLDGFIENWNLCFPL